MNLNIAIWCSFVDEDTRERYNVSTEISASCRVKDLVQGLSALADKIERLAQEYDIVQVSLPAFGGELLTTKEIHE